MAIYGNIDTFQFVFFESVVHFIILGSFITVFIKARELYQLSMQKGLWYFRNSFFYFTMAFAASYLNTYLYYFFGYSNFMLDLILVYCGTLGGLSLSHSLMWRRLDRYGRWPGIWIHLIALIAIGVEVYMETVLRISSNYFVFAIVILSLIFAVYYNRKRYVAKAGDPFLAALTLAIGTYLLVFIESLVYHVLPVIHFYIWGMISVFAYAVYYNVNRIAG